MPETGKIVLFIVLGTLVGMMFFYNLMLSRMNKRVEKLEVSLLSMISIFIDTCSALSKCAKEAREEMEGNSKPEE